MALFNRWINMSIHIERPVSRLGMCLSIMPFSFSVWCDPWVALSHGFRCTCVPVYGLLPFSGCSYRVRPCCRSRLPTSPVSTRGQRTRSTSPSIGMISCPCRDSIPVVLLFRLISIPISIQCHCATGSSLSCDTVAVPGS